MICRRRHFAWAWASIVWLGCCTAAHAGFPFLFREPRPPVQPYTPQVQQYVVVDPAPLATRSMAQHDAPAAGAFYSWRQIELPAASYPWGWFGAGPRSSFQTHTSYYDNHRDWTIHRDGSR